MLYLKMHQWKRNLAELCKLMQNLEQIKNNELKSSKLLPP